MMIATLQLDKFRQVYADAVIPYENPDQWSEVYPLAVERRELNWRGERCPLAEAAEMYAAIDNYNEFSPNMLSMLLAEFSDGIEVTPAREYSVAVYLHVPIGLRRQVRVFVEEHFNADEIDWVKADTLRVWWD